MSFPRYPAYKDSGVEWLGEVPEHWEVKPLRGLALEGRASFIDGDWIESPFITDEGIRLIQTGNIGVGRYKEQGFRFVSEQTFEQLGCTEVLPGDVLICRLADPVGRACRAPELETRMITSVDVCILKPRRGVSPDFVVYMLSSAHYLGFMESQCRGGTRDRVSRSFLGSARISMPSESEQASISSFLDLETAKIDALIAEQQRLIELLQEKRQAVISHAVTKGLNPDAPMKDSGVEWLGEVPEHWEVKPLKYLMMLTGGGTPSKENLAYWDGSIPWASSKDLKTDDLLDTQDHISQKALDDGAATLVPTGSILTVVRGMILLHTFPVVVTHVPMAINQDLKAILPVAGIAGSYLALLLRGASGEILSRIDEAGHGTKVLRIDSWLSMHVPVPPPIEQDLIVASILNRLQAIDALSVHAQQAVGLFQERSSALISAAVTGQIDVRGLLPAEVSG